MEEYDSVMQVYKINEAITSTRSKETKETEFLYRMRPLFYYSLFYDVVWII